jgi:dTMP kinase
MSHQTGRFIVLEGIDGAGTTTQAARLQDWLSERGVQSMVTREPSDGPIGNTIRHALRGRLKLPDVAGGGELPKETIALLFAADRIDHIEAEIKPALARGIWVISDRYVQSSIAYQGTLIDLDWVAEINRYAIAPDLTLFLRIGAEVGLQRIDNARLQTDIFETRELLDRIAAGYDAYYAAHPQSAVVLDGTLPLDAVSEAVFDALVRAYPELRS